MYLGKKILAIIPARKGSKRLKNKNLKKINKLSLVEISINQALNSKYIDDIIVSSDSEKILKIAASYNDLIPHKRKKHLSTTKSLIMDLVIELIQLYNKYNYILLLQPTSPLRVTGEIDECIRKTIKHKILSMVSMIEAKNYPNFIYHMNKDNILKPISGGFNDNTNSQSHKKYYIPSGDIYLSEKNWLLKERKFINKRTRGYLIKNRLSIDIDNEKDLYLAKLLFKDSSINK
tara:strand:+ start:1775 stop:2473 length:699 start_codon:yes stop_codon:yes gene_type:complete